MMPKRLSVKFYLKDPADIDLSAFVAIFQRWIQKERVEGLLIDVADYHHVHQGPGVILIGDEGDYGMDLGEGRPGLLYTRKRQMPDTLTAALGESYRLAIRACEALRMEKSLKGQEFDYALAKITFLDRLHSPNTAEVFANLQPEIGSFASGLYGSATVTRGQTLDHPGEPLRILIQATSPVNSATLLEHLESGQFVRE